jgi:hypothetical protein
MNTTSQFYHSRGLILAAVLLPLMWLLGGCYSYRTLNEEEETYGKSHASEGLRLTLRDGSTLEAKPSHHVDMRTPSEAVFAKGSRTNRTTGVREEFVGSFPAGLLDSMQVLGVQSARYTRWYLNDTTMIQCSNANHLRVSMNDEPAILCMHARVNDSDSLFTGPVPYRFIAEIEVEGISTTKTLLFATGCVALTAAATSFARSTKEQDEAHKAMAKWLNTRVPY